MYLCIFVCFMNTGTPRAQKRPSDLLCQELPTFQNKVPPTFSDHQHDVMMSLLKASVTRFYCYHF